VAEFVAGYEAGNWFGICAPKATPAEIVEKLNTEINNRRHDDCALRDGLTLPQFAQAYLWATNMVTAMEETGQAEARRTSDLPALAVYSIAVLLLILAWAHFPA
jgi:hypothetical protein